MTTLALPTVPKIRGQKFELQRLDARNPARGGQHLGIAYGEPMWTAEITTTDLSPAQGGSWKWLLARLRGGLRGLYVYDASRTRPLAYADLDDLDAPTADSTAYTADLAWITADAEGAGAIKPWGTPRITAVNRAASTITLEGFKPSATISAGDYGAWDDGDVRRLHILGPATAAADGTVTLNCEPAPPTSSASLPAAFTMEKAAAEMIVLDANVSFAAPVVQSATLTATQVLRR